MTQKWPKWGSETGQEPNGDRNRSKTPKGKKKPLHFGGHFGASLASKIWSFFCYFLKGSFLALWAPLGSSWEGKWSQKGPKRCPKVTISRLEWISENDGFTEVKPSFLRFRRSLETTWKQFLKWKRPKELSKGVRGSNFADFVRFLRFWGSLWEAIWGQKSDKFSDSIFDHFLNYFLEGSAAEADPPGGLQEPERPDWRLGTPCHTLRGGGGFLIKCLWG